ncbi:MAG TPA: DUF1254 domain-containing protein [Caulobacteraceae bacterium]|nr:DUF1254 domain-containing protein [Caulobacteraceae bacterium]
MAYIERQRGSAAAIPVTPDNFNQAESDLMFTDMVKDGAFGKFVHHREPPPLDFPVIRPNRDTLYSVAIFDLAAGPVTVTMPDAAGRFMSMQVVDEEQYAPAVYYGAGVHTLTRAAIGTRYVTVGIRTLVDLRDPGDVRQAHALQDAIRVAQPGGPGRFEPPRFDQVSQSKVREALLALAETMTETRRAFGPRGEVDPIHHLIGTAMGFGGNPEKDALYLNVTPAANDGRTVYRLTAKDVPVDAFWSISVYDAHGHFRKNDLDAYSLNNLTAVKDADGSVSVQFGGCEAGAAPNCLPIMPGWNYLVRLYRPRPEILDGRWTFPEASPVH